MLLEENLKLKNIISNKNKKVKKIKNIFSITCLKNKIIKKEKNINSNKKELFNKKEKDISKKPNKKDIILDKNLNKIIKFFYKKYKFRKKFKNKPKRFFNSQKKIISIVGNAGVGKSTFISVLSRVFEGKILIADLDFLNQSQKVLFGIEEFIVKENCCCQNDIRRYVITISNNIDLISGINCAFDNEYKLDNNKFKKTIEDLQDKYDVLIFDTSSECFFDFYKDILFKSNEIIFLSEANLSELKKLKRLLDIYVNDWQINKNKFGIIFNKFNDGSIHQKILKMLFKDFKILGYLKMNKNYNCLINNNMDFIDKNIEKEIQTIAKKIEKEIYKSETSVST